MDRSISDQLPQDLDLDKLRNELQSLLCGALHAEALVSRGGDPAKLATILRRLVDHARAAAQLLVVQPEGK